MPENYSATESLTITPEDEAMWAIFPTGLYGVIGVVVIRRAVEAYDRGKDKDKDDDNPKPPSRPNARIGRALLGFT